MADKIQLLFNHRQYMTLSAANMGITHLIGSDMSGDMVKATTQNLEGYIAEEKTWQERILAVG